MIGYLNRAYKACSTWTLFNEELSKIKQILINNGYCNSFVDHHVSEFLNTVNLTREHAPNLKNVYYRNQYHHNYRQDEYVLRKIFKNNVIPKGCDTKLVIYYKCKRSNSFVMKNNLCMKPKRTLAQTDVVYQFTCPADGCHHPPTVKRRYVGHTVCTLSRRMSFHLQNGAIKDHFEHQHGRKLTRSDIVDNTIIRYVERDPVRLKILEALIIKFEKPEINLQDTGHHRILVLYS